MTVRTKEGGRGSFKCQDECDTSEGDVETVREKEKDEEGRRNRVRDHRVLEVTVVQHRELSSRSVYISTKAQSSGYFYMHRCTPLMQG